MEVAKKELILDVAAKTFAERGLKKASIDLIAQRAGVAKGTIYLACESKEDLFYQALHRELHAWIGAVAGTIDLRQPADELLPRAYDAANGYLASHPLVRDLLLGVCEIHMPEWATQFEALRVLGRAPIVEILRLGVQQGVFRRELDVEETAKILQDIHLAAVTAEENGSDHASRKRRQRASHALVLGGVLAKRRG